MAKEILQEHTEPLEIDGQTIFDEDGATPLQIYKGHITKATPNGGGSEYIRLHLAGGSFFLWNAPLADWNEDVEIDPAVETRWVKE